MSKKPWYPCPTCRTPMSRLYFHLKNKGFKSTGLFWCYHCDDYYKLQKGASQVLVT